MRRFVQLLLLLYAKFNKFGRDLSYGVLVSICLSGDVHPWVQDYLSSSTVAFCCCFLPLGFRMSIVASALGCAF